MVDEKAPRALTGALRVWTPRPGARVRLLCLPPAAGTAAVYQAWGEMLPPSVEVVAAELPGHGGRHAEPFATSFGEVVGEVVDAITALPALPVAVYGHSLGAVFALSVSRALRDGTGAGPHALLVSSSDAPSALTPAAGSMEKVPESRLRELLNGLGGLDDALDDPELITATVSALRADLALLGGYRYSTASPLRCPVRVYAGVQDPATTPAGLAAWRRENPGDFRLSRIPGGHFFFRGYERSHLTRLIPYLT